MMSWLLKQFCRHPRQIMRRREEGMGYECTSCFRWTPMQSKDPTADWYREQKQKAAKGATWRFFFCWPHRLCSQQM
jgi:hypothetical protein